jgi:hypothetical protein
MSQRIKIVCWGVAILFCCTSGYCQSVDSAANKLANFPTKLFGRIQSKTASLDQQLTNQTEKYLQRMAKREEKLRKKLSAVDSNAAKNLFAGSAERYAALEQKLKNDTGSRATGLSGEYRPFIDSLKGSLSFLKQNQQLLAAGKNSDPAALAQLQGASSQFQALQAKLGDADQIKAYVQQRNQQLSQYISQHANLEGLLGKPFANLKQQSYYYSQQVNEYKEMLNDPDKLEKKALSLLNQVPAFQTFMKNNSQLASLFNLPPNYASTTSLAGLQTRSQISDIIQNQVAAGGAGGASALQSNMQSADAQLDGFKDKLSKLGSGSGDVDMPDFKPNDQKTKTFWRRLEYGTNFQTTRNNYYFPTVTDLGFSLGYKLGHSNVVGVGASYKLGWGNGVQHIALSSQGMGLRSFLDIKIKSSFSATGGFEYNYTTPFTSFQDIKQIDRWTKSGLIGISKTVSTKSRVFKKTKLQLLWDFLSYEAVPKTQPILFRLGYTF